MKTGKISEFGSITLSGQLRLPMDRLNAFFEANKGKRVVVNFEVAESGTTELQLAYYFKYVVPTIQAALLETGERKTEKQTDLWLRHQCGFCYDGDYELLDVRELTKTEFSNYLEWLKQFAAENLYVYVEDPKTL